MPLNEPFIKACISAMRMHAGSDEPVWFGGVPQKHHKGYVEIRCSMEDTESLKRVQQKMDIIPGADVTLSPAGFGKSGLQCYLPAETTDPKLVVNALREFPPETKSWEATRARLGQALDAALVAGKPSVNTAIQPNGIVVSSTKFGAVTAPRSPQIYPIKIQHLVDKRRWNAL